jgi:hypothetical protein
MVLLGRVLFIVFHFIISLLPWKEESLDLNDLNLGHQRTKILKVIKPKV